MFEYYSSTPGTIVSMTFVIAVMVAVLMVVFVFTNKGLGVSPIEIICIVLIPPFVVIFLGLMLSSLVEAVEDRPNTDKLSEANFVKSEEFSNKIVEVSQIDALSFNSQKVIDELTVKDLKDEKYVKLYGAKGDNEFSLRVSFKNDTMIVKIAPVEENSGTETYEYSPK